MSKPKKNIAGKIIFTLCLLISTAIVFTITPAKQYLFALLNISASEKTDETSEPAEQTEEFNELKKVEVHFIDAGQGECILVKSNDGNVLIDSGKTNQDEILAYLKEKNVFEFNKVIISSLESEHMGMTQKIMDSFKVNELCLPYFPTNLEPITDVYKSINSYKKTYLSTGDKFNVGEIEFTVLSPNKSDKFETIDEYSLVISMKYGTKTFLFTGDISANAEYNMYLSDIIPKTDVLKVASHGANTATSKQFIEKTNPEYAVICVGTTNNNGCPHQDTIDILTTTEAKILRTDKYGTIVIYSDGNLVKIADR